jgi:hypothetical protein
VQGAERREREGALVGEKKAHDTPVAGVVATGDEPRLLGARDELDGAVVADDERAGDVGDRGGCPIEMGAHREQQLGERRCQPGGSCRPLGDLLGAACPLVRLGEAAVVLVADPRSCSVARRPGALTPAPRRQQVQSGSMPSGEGSPPGVSCSTQGMPPAKMSVVCVPR